ncbi:siderophore-interacting protein [Ensifer aridi]|uniref:siderophore-interacting protein n=1 Tax=Ensifer aridi TaxID=1708715 RepID=UPI000412F5D1|nr:siderophore-interacting protein [Ensifer aridi]
MRGFPYGLQAKIIAEKPEHLFEHLHDHLLEHDVDTSLSGGSLFVELAAVSGTLRLTESGIEADVSAADLEALYFVKVWLEDAVTDGPDARTIRIEWSESGLQRHLPPSFSILTVDSVTDITPRLRRVSFRVADAGLFATSHDMHLRILFNLREIAEQHAWQQGRQGALRSHIRPIWRAYTIRSVERASNTIAIDFLMHDAEGPGCCWARRAKRGDVIGAAGPSGGGLVEAQWYLLAGDETALPAISRILESLDETTAATVIIEVATSADVIPFTSPAAVEVKWLYRNASGGDCRGDLVQAIATANIPDASRKRFAWVACEAKAAKKVREILRDRGLAKDEQSVAAYWHAV